MNYYNLDKINKNIRIEMLKNGYSDEYRYLPTLLRNLNDNENIKLKITKQYVYISEKDLVVRIMDIKNIFKQKNVNIDFNNINILDCLLEPECVSPDENILDFSGILPKGKLGDLKIEAQKKMLINPFYISFKNLIDLNKDQEKCIAMDFEFSGKFGITEFGVTYIENGKKVSRFYKIKNTPNRKIDSLFTKEEILIDENELKNLIRNYTNSFNTFIFHDRNSEKQLMRRLFGSLIETPFNGKKNIIDTLDVSRYAMDRDIEYSESGFDKTLTGLCKYFNINPENMHNAANDSRYAFNVAQLFFKKYEEKIKYYNERDELNKEIIRKEKTVKLKKETKKREIIKQYDNDEKFFKDIEKKKTLNQREKRNRVIRKKRKINF